MSTYGMTTESIAAAHAEAEDATAGLTDEEKAYALKFAATVIRMVDGVARTGVQLGKVSNPAAWTLAVLKAASKSFEAMEMIHAPGGMAEASPG